MLIINYQLNIRTVQDKQQVFCDWRRKWVRLTPEELVRQHVLHLLVEDFGYPKSLIAVEHPIRVADVSKRCDAVILAADWQPLCIVEFKAEHVRLTQKVFDQVAVYNRALNVRFLIVSNGHDTYACQVTPTGYDFFRQLPTYPQLIELCSVANGKAD